MLYISVGTIIVLLLVIILISYINRARIKKDQLTGIMFITQLKSIISLVQKHRGLTSAWLNGDVKVEPQLLELKEKVRIIIDKINKTDLKTSERWIGFYDHWQRLLSLRNKPSVTNSFDQHCLLIKNLAYLLEDTADSHFLTADHLDKLPNIGFTWRELIMSAENIGQSRAIGTSVSAQKNCSSIDKIRLNFLTETMNDVSKNTLKKLSYLSEEKTQHDNLVSQATKKIDALINTISKELVNSPKITIENQQYFTLATDTMSSFEHIFEHQIKQLSKVI